MEAKGLKHLCRTGFAGRAPADDYPLANRFDEVDTLLIFDDVEIPWEDVLFYRHTRAAAFIRGTLHRYSAFAFVQRNLRVADLMIGAALFNVRQTGLEKQQAVQEKLAQLACYREGINAHLTAAIALAEPSPGGPPDAEPVAALLRPRARLLAAAPPDAPGPRALRRPDLRDAGRRDVPRRGAGPLARQVLLHQRRLAGGRPPQAARLRARPPELRLRRPPADVPALRAVAAVRAPERRLPVVRLGRPARPREGRRRSLRSRASRSGRARRPSRSRPPGATGERPHRRGRPRARAPVQHRRHVSGAAARQRPLPGRVAGDTIYLRGQVAQDLDTRENVARRRPRRPGARR